MANQTVGRSSPNGANIGDQWFDVTSETWKTWDGTSWITSSSSSTGTVDIEFVIDGGGSVLTTGVKGYLLINQALTIQSASLLADQTGSVVVDIFKSTYAQFDAGSTHPVSNDKITASAPPTIASATKAQDTVLTGWNKAISAGDVLGFNVNSVTTITRVTLILKCLKS